MKRSIYLITLLLLFAITVGASAQQNQTPQDTTQYAVGYVFSDTNNNSIRDDGEKGIKGVRVSNGQTSVKTNRSGAYKIPVTDDTIIFVIKPRNWRTAVDANNVPRFYYIHKPNGSPKLKFKGVDPTGPLPKSVDFPLYPNPEPNRYEAVFLGDTQVRDIKEINYLAHDIIEELVGTKSAFAVSLGDIAFNDLSVYEPIVPVMGRMGIPCHYVKGNHDSNYDGAPNQKLINETYERVFGPSYYSFDYGPVHFIALDNPNFSKGENYFGQLDPEQMDFLRDDLASIPQKQLVVLMMHIPIISMRDSKEIFKLLETHPNTFSIAAHWHSQVNYFVSESDGWNAPKPHHLLINGTSCGSWWHGALDEVGLPHTTMKDGAPNGYSIITFDGNKYSVRFKAARRPDNYQMNIYAPDAVEAANLEKTEVLANIFAGSDASKVEMQLGDTGTWIPMKRVQMQDPVYIQTKEREDSMTPPPGVKLPNADICTHMWSAYLPKDAVAGAYLIKVRTTDMFGQVYNSSRVITIQ